MMGERRGFPGGPPPARGPQRRGRRWLQPRGRWFGSTGLPAGPRPLPTRTASRAQPSPTAGPVRSSHRRRDRPAPSGRHTSSAPSRPTGKRGACRSPTSLAGPSPKQKSPHQATKDAIRRAALPGTGLGAMRPCADERNGANRQSMVRVRPILLGLSSCRVSWTTLRLSAAATALSRTDGPGHPSQAGARAAAHLRTAHPKRGNVGILGRCHGAVCRPLRPSRKDRQ